MVYFVHGSPAYSEKKDKEYVESGSGEADQMLASSDHRKDLLTRRIDHSLAAGGSKRPGRGSTALLLLAG